MNSIKNAGSLYTIVNRICCYIVYESVADIVIVYFMTLLFVCVLSFFSFFEWNIQTYRPALRASDMFRVTKRSDYCRLNEMYYVHLAMYHLHEQQQHQQ